MSNILSGFEREIVLLLAGEPGDGLMRVFVSGKHLLLYTSWNDLSRVELESVETSLSNSA